MKVWLPAVRAGSGTDVFTVRLQEALEARGVEAVISWFPHRYELLPEGMARHPVPAGTELIHANSWNACAFLGLGLPVVTTVHHLVHDPAFRPYRSLAQALYHAVVVRGRERRAVRDSARVTSVSAYVAVTVASVFGRQNVVPIHNWVDTARFCPGEPGTRNTPFRLLLVGNQSRRKGADLLPALGARLGAGYELRCTGGLRGTAGGGEQGNVRWLGRLDEDELIHEYQACDAVLSLSRYEGFGYSALEAMACARPFIGFRCGALAEVVEEGRTALLAALDDLAGIEAACERLRQDPGLARTLGEAGRQRALAVFSREQAIDKYLEIYRQAIALRREERGESVKDP